MDWPTIIASTGLSAGVFSVLGYVFKRWLMNNINTDAADARARKIHMETIDFLQNQLRDRDERISALQAAHLESRRSMDREIRVFRGVTQSMARDMRVINDGRIPEERLETMIHVTGMGPLDP